MKYKKTSQLTKIFGPIRKRKVRWDVWPPSSRVVLSYRSHKRARNKAISLGPGTYINRQVLLRFKDGSTLSYSSDLTIIR